MKKNRWITQLAAFPYAQPFLMNWQAFDYSKDLYWLEYEQALDSYLASQDEDLSLNQRYSELEKSKKLFNQLYLKGDRHIGTSLALIRIYSELDEYQAALNSIENMLQIMPWLTESLPNTLKIHVNRPFLAPTNHFDNVNVENLAQWLQDSVLDVLSFLDEN